MSNFAIFRVIGSLLGVVYGMIPGRRENRLFLSPDPQFSRKLYYCPRGGATLGTFVHLGVMEGLKKI